MQGFDAPLIVVAGASANLVCGRENFYDCYQPALGHISYFNVQLGDFIWQQIGQFYRRVGDDVIGFGFGRRGGFWCAHNAHMAKSRLGGYLVGGKLNRPVYHVALV